MNLYRPNIILFLLFGFSILKAQSGFELSASYLKGFQFDRDITVWNGSVSNYQNEGLRLLAHYSYRKEEGKLEGLARVGVKRLYSSGTIENEPFSAKTTKALVSLGGHYWWGSSTAIGLFAGMENNRDFEDLRISTSDNFRYNFQLSLTQKIVERLFLEVGYIRALYPIEDEHLNQYLIFNPTHQFSGGIIYRIF